jgi:hypothetical protein
MRVFAKAPDVPDNIGKLDVGAIYDRVSQGVNLARAASDATRAAAAGNTDLQTELAKQSAIRGLIPAQTAAAASTAAGETATGAATASKGNFLAGLSGPQRISADQGVVPGQTVSQSRIYDTSDPKNPRLVDKEETYVPGSDGKPVLTGTRVSSVFSPRDIQVFKEHTDTNGNIVTTDGTYRQLDVSKPAFQIDKEGNIAPILGANGQPINAALVAATGKAERGTPVSSGVSGDAGRIANFEQIMADHPDTATTLQPLVDQLKQNITATTSRTAAGAEPTKGDPGAQLIQRISAIKQDISDAATSDDPKVQASVPGLQSTLNYYNTRLNALNAPKGKQATGSSLSTYVAPGSAAPATGAAAATPAPAAGQVPSLVAGDTAGYAALAPRSQYTVPSQPGVVFTKPGAPAAAPTDAQPGQ